MFLPTSLTTRRAFLERSLLGFGSAFVLPSLLASCTDHVIDPTNPNPPDGNPPLLGDGDSVDYNGDAKTVVTTGLQLVPEVGGFLSSLVDIFWPSSGDSPWGQVRAQVEALIEQTIDNNVYQAATTALGQQASDTEPASGLFGQLALYLNEVKNGDSSNILNRWQQAQGFFVQNLGVFQYNGPAGDFRLLLLPVFAQYVNLYLSLLRDAIVGGLSWGMTLADYEQNIAYNTKTIAQFIAYTKQIYNDGLTNLKQNIPHGPSDATTNQPFLSVNKFTREMTLTVLDYATAWQYFDTDVYSTYPPPVQFTREIYSDPYGNTRKAEGYQPNPIILPSQATQFPTAIAVWGDTRIDAVQLTYANGGGPGGVTQTSRMGDPKNGHLQADYAGLAGPNPITKVQVTYDYPDGNVNNYTQVINSMSFTFSNGQPSSPMGGKAGKFNSGVIGWTNNALSSIYINGVNATYGNSANCIVFGFLYWQSPTEVLRAVRTFYVKSPKEHSVDEFAKAFPKVAIPANLITAELKAARDAYWARIKARAHK